jgi:hypothetical protein
MKNGWYIWQIEETEGGDPAAIARVAKENGITDVMLKVADGSSYFGFKGSVDLVPPVIAALRAGGVTVWGWQYVYGFNSALEAKCGADRCKMLNLDRFIFDVESEMKKSANLAAALQASEAYLTAFILACPNVLRAFSSYRWPSYHNDFPWKPWFDKCQIAMPQVYWVGAANAGAQLTRCLAEYKLKSATIKIMPTGAAWKENGWRVTADQAYEFIQVAKTQNLELISWWDWQQCRRDLPDVWEAIRSNTQPQASTDNRLPAIEEKLAALCGDTSSLVGKLEAVISDLRSYTHG